MGKELYEYTEKELRQELYRRSKINKISKRDENKCFNCKNRLCYTDAKRLANKGELPYKLNTFGLGSICSKRRAVPPFNPDEHFRIFNTHTTTCDLFERK